MKKKTTKASYLTRLLMTLLTAVLIVLFLWIMSLVSKIQGTARVVNYAGLVRGGTQRIIKLEDNGTPRDDLIEGISSIIKGLRFGSDELHLVRLEDSAFQDKMEELNADFDDLTAEIALVREYGYENTQIIEKSEQFFTICDQAVSLAEDYSQKMATSLNKLEQIVIIDISGLVLLIAFELVRALRYAALNRILQGKVYLDEATGLPNKNKCEELLSDPRPAGAEGPVALFVFDLNNLRIINNNLGHDKGDEYIRSFATQLRLAVDKEQFVGRDGGDEFIAILKGADQETAAKFLADIRRFCGEYSASHPQMPISFAAGYALSTDFEDCTLRELFRHADQNMYVDKNRAKMEEAAKERELNLKLLDSVRQRGFHFSDCLYCDLLLDQYRALRTSSGFFLAEDGSYSGAVEQIIEELSSAQNRKELRLALNPSSLVLNLTAENPKIELFFERTQDGHLQKGRLTLLYVDGTSNGSLHHFLLGFETFSNEEAASTNERSRLQQYYEQLKQSILENGNYVEALLDTAQAVYEVNLTQDKLENAFFHAPVPQFDIEEALPISYDAYCRTRSREVTADTLENYRLVDSSEKLLERFRTGAKQIAVEYCETDKEGKPVWLQKTVLMSQETAYEEETGLEHTIVRGILLFKDTSAFHQKEQQEKEKLQAAYEQADQERREKTEFLNRMSHDIRTPINGVLGMVAIIRKNRDNPDKVEDCLRKISLSADHLLALVNDVLDMSKLNSGQAKFESTAFDLLPLMDEVTSLVNAQLIETGVTHQSHRENLQHTRLIGSPLHLRQIMLNLFSNAIKYNKPGGRIDTYAKELSCDGHTVFMEFKIIDTGVGMSEDFVRSQLFEPFTQEKSDARTQYRGTGLGMSIVKQLVTQQGGTINVQSILGQGTTFTFTLPFAVDGTPADKFKADMDSSLTANCKSGSDVPQSDDSKSDIASPLTASIPSTSSAPSQGTSLSGLTLLLAEDNEINMEIAEFYLTECGASVDKVWNGKEALEHFAQSAPGTYAAILMDVMMPVMDGLEAARRIRALNRPDAKTIPIIAMTAQRSSDNVKTCLEAGMTTHLPKPLEEESLAQTILHCTQKQPGAQ